MNAHLYNKKLYWLVSVITLGMLFLAACQPQVTLPVTGGSSPAPQAAAPQAAPAATATTAAAAASSEAVINVATDPKLGKILVGNNGMTLYMFTKDGPDVSNCNGGCAKAWPPLFTQGSPTLGAGVDKSLVGTIARADGTKMVTYNKMPLYYYVKDGKPGDVTGQDTFNHTWFVVSPDGKVVGMMPPAAPAMPAAPTMPPPPPARY